MFRVMSNSCSLSHAKHWLPIKEPNWELDLFYSALYGCKHLGHEQNQQQIYLCRLVCTRGNEAISSGRAVWEFCTCFRASGSSVCCGLCMRPYPWSSPGNFLFLLPNMVMWHLQQVVPIRSWHSVTVTHTHTTPPTPGPNTMWQGNRARNHQDLIIWPFPFRFDLFRWILSKITERNPFFFCLIVQNKNSSHVGGPLSRKPHKLSLLFAWVTVWSDYLAPAAACSGTKMTNNLWKTARRLFRRRYGRQDWIHCRRPHLTHRLGVTLVVCQRWRPNYLCFINMFTVSFQKAFSRVDTFLAGNLHP